MIEELFGLSGRTAIVTGSSTGLGQGISLALSGAGANVVGVDYVKSTDTAKIIGERGGAFTEVVADLMTTAPIDGIIEKAVQTYGGLDILVNNAGIIRREDSLDFSEKNWDDVMAINAKTVFFFSQAAARVFKTLVTQGADRNYYVFVVPVLAELDLKKAAKAAGVKSVAMIHVADINKVTGYIRGGCSPVGMKKQFVTVYDESCLAQQTMLVSGGRIGTQIECAPADLIKVTRGRTAAITQEHEA